MAKQEFSIGAQELAKGLGMSAAKLYKVVDFFDADSKDEWELKEGEHFIWLSKNAKTRLFSEFGAYAIAKYLDSINKNPWDKLKEFVFHHKAKLRRTFIRNRVLENSASLVKIGDYHFISKKDLVNILLTSHTRLNTAFKDLQTSDESMQINVDFADIEGESYFGLRGAWRIAELLGKELKSQDRRAWCAEVSVTAPTIIKLLLDEEAAFYKKVDVAKAAAKKRDKGKCQITGKKTSQASPINISAHHIYSYKYYPEIAAVSDNIITLTEAIHRDFHNWNGGSSKPCTPDLLMEYCNLRYPDTDAIHLRLRQVKKLYGHLEQKTGDEAKEFAVVGK
jgi:hypothetical protein